MSTKAFEFDGAKFVTNNYAAVLTNDEAPSEFHLIQDYLAHSEFMYALTQPEVISPAQVLTLWRSARYNDGGEHGSPSLTCTYEGQEYLITPETVRKALHLPEHSKYHSAVSTQTLKDMMQFFGYSGSTDKMGELKRPYWLIFSYCFPLVPIPDTDTELPFKITKRAFTDLMKKDSKKAQLPIFAIPVTVQDKLKQAMPDKYDPIFSDENIASSSHQPQDVPSSGPSQKGPVVKSDHKSTSGPSQKGSVVTSSPTRVLRSSKSPSKPSPPPRKRRFLQKISDSDSDHEDVPTPLVSRPRKKIKPTSTITDLTVDPPQESMVNPLEMVTVSDPLMVEPLSAVPLTTSSEHTPEADIPMSENIPESEDLLPQPPAADIPSSGTTPEEHVSTPEAHVITPEEHVSTPEAHVTTPEEHVSTPEIAQETLIPVEDFVAAPDQEILNAANSEGATAPLCSHTISITAHDDDDDTEVNSVPPVDSGSLIAEISALLQESISVREVSPIQTFSPVKVPSPVRDSSPAPDSEIPHSVSTKSKVCTLTYSRNMHRAPSSSVEARLSSIESTQRSMQQTLADLSSSVAQLVQFLNSNALNSNDVKKGEMVLKDKCKVDQQQRKPNDEEEDEEKKKAEKSENTNSEMVLHTQTEGNRRDKVGSSSATHKVGSSSATQTQTTKSQPLIPADSKSRALSEQLVELGNPESKILSHTVKIHGEETTLFYKAPTQLDFDEAVAKNIFEQENPGVSIEDIRKEEDQPRVYQKKSYSDSSGKGKNVIDGVPSEKKTESKLTLATIPESIDQNLASNTAQAKNMKEGQLKSAEVKATWIKSTSDKAQVDTVEPKKKSLFGSLGSVQYKESSLFTQIRDKGTRGKEARDTTGLRHSQEKMQTSVATVFRDPYPLTEKAGEVVTQKDLDRIESAQILMDTHDGPEDKEKIAIFLESGRVYRISEADQLLKSLRELEHIHYMLEIKNEATKRWSERLKRTIQEKRRFYGISSDVEYVPKITQEDGSEINMEKNSSVLETIAGTRILGYNNEADRPGAIQLGEAMKRCKARALRSAIYQTGEDNEEIKTVKAQMIQTLKQIEEDLITQFVKESYGYRLIG
ncbi:flocculation protein FLO11-like [Daucus carota subsp. sativus]|uniref:flocculation protein FLO11-like n=1 Tax=Daucus carota subsp. sativus TaxID=79200 RepID=UPI0030828593